MHSRTVRLDVDVGSYGVVTGRVGDETSNPIARVELSLDGLAASSGRDGRFAIPRRFSGEPLLIARREGYASHRVCLRGASVERPIEITLQRACRLEVEIAGTGDAVREVLVCFLPMAGGMGGTAAGLQQTYPWSMLNLRRLQSNVPALIEDLPAGRVDIVPVHHLARGRPVSVWLHPDRTATATIHMEPIPTLSGRVLRAGRTLPGATVVLAAENPMYATVALFGQAFKSLPIELAPAGHQQVVTDSRGQFLLGAWRGANHLSVTDPAGGDTRHLSLDPGQDEIEVDLDVSPTDSRSAGHRSVRRLRRP